MESRSVLILTSGRSLGGCERAMSRHDRDGSRPCGRRGPHIVRLVVLIVIVTDVVCGLFKIRSGEQVWQKSCASLPSELGVNECT